MHVISITNSEYKSWMLRDGFRTHKDSARATFVGAYQDAHDLLPLGNQRDDASRQSWREPVIASLTVYRFYKYLLESG